MVFSGILRQLSVILTLLIHLSCLSCLLMPESFFSKEFDYSFLETFWIKTSLASGLLKPELSNLNQEIGELSEFVSKILYLEDPEF